MVQEQLVEKSAGRLVIRQAAISEYDSIAVAADEAAITNLKL